LPILIRSLFQMKKHKRETHFHGLFDQKTNMKTQTKRCLKKPKRCVTQERVHQATERECRKMAKKQEKERRETMKKAIIASFEANAALIARQEIFLETYDFYAELDKKFPVKLLKGNNCGEFTSTNDCPEDTKVQ